jgi:FRG domain
VPKASQFAVTVPVFALDPRDGNVTTWDAVSALFPGFTFSTSAEISVSLNGDTLAINWKTADGAAVGSASIPRSSAGQPSELKPVAVDDWNAFKAYVTDSSPYEFIFRGHQRNDWRLRTSFHRTGHSNLERYGNITIPTVLRYISAQTSHFFNNTDTLQYGAFVTLIQHHGFPTPLLDWTYSPYVAAFFAYNGISKEQAEAARDTDRVRIFQFAKRQWGRVPQILKLAPLAPHFSILEALAIENKRIVPQQGVSTITNVDDIETYIQYVEQLHNTRYLFAIDLPVRQRTQVMRELAIMGVTAGALFPGLDGSCAELRERFFGL